MKTKKLTIFLTIILIGVLSIFIVDYVYKPGYWIKSLIKIIFLVIIPFLYLFSQNKTKLKNILIPNKNSFLKSIGLGIIVYSIVIIAYKIVGYYFDFSSIAKSVENNYGVTISNIIPVMLYISFINSFIEEFFFRGLSFIYAKNFFGKKFAYIFSSLIFGIYHIPMMNGWFTNGNSEYLILALALFGLIIGGLIFNFLDDKNENIYNSWMVHIFADLALLTIAFIIFGVV